MSDVQLVREQKENRTEIKLLVDDEPASGLVVFDLCMRVGGTVARCGGIGGVHTSPAHRMKGYARCVLDESLRFMREEGYHISALFGIPDFYHRFGFVPALVLSEYTVLTRYAEQARLRHSVREMRPKDARDVARMYETQRAGRAGSIVRDPNTWTGFQKGGDWSSRVGAFVVSDGSEIVGYASYNLDPHRYAIGEVGHCDPAVMETILAEAARRAVEQRVERITFHGPIDEAFARFARRYGAELKQEYQVCSGPMARIIDQTALLGLMASSLQDRLTVSEHSGWRGSVRVVTNLGTDIVRLGCETPLHNLRVPQERLVQLLLGYASVEDLRGQKGVSWDAEMEPLLATLFPEACPYMWPSDWF